MPRSGVPKSWTRALQVIGGFALILIAVWVIVLGGPGGSVGSSDESSASSSDSHSGSSAPGGASSPDSGLDKVPESALPPQGRETLDLIRSDGPFPYDRDGLTFQNREGTLPQHERGYYAEYTVPTPGENDRGARRIVDGDAGDRYYTEDHYASFRQIQEGQ